MGKRRDQAKAPESKQKQSSRFFTRLAAAAWTTVVLAAAALLFLTGTMPAEGFAPPWPPVAELLRSAGLALHTGYGLLAVLGALLLTLFPAAAGARRPIVARLYVVGAAIGLLALTAAWFALGQPVTLLGHHLEEAAPPH